MLTLEPGQVLDATCESAHAITVLGTWYSAVHDWKRVEELDTELEALLPAMTDDERRRTERGRLILDVCVTTERREFDRTPAIVEELKDSDRN